MKPETVEMVESDTVETSSYKLLKNAELVALVLGIVLYSAYYCMFPLLIKKLTFIYVI